MNLMDGLTFEQQASRNFLLQRCTFQRHPIQEERKKERILYVSLLNRLVRSQLDPDPELTACLQRLLQVLDVSAEEMKAEETAIPKGLKKLASVFWHGGFSFGLKNYQALCLVESVCLVGLVAHDSKEKMQAVLADFCKTGKIAETLQQSLTDYFNHLFTVTVMKPGKELAASASYLDFMYGRLFRYRELPRYHVAICATMSAGKSTFINSLLGSDYIPSGNEACTAKITSIADNDIFPELLGCCREKEVLHPPVTLVTNEVLQTWNMNEDIAHVFLEGDLQGVGSEQTVLVVHDTPGTNSSENPLHHQRTMDFLKHHPLQTIVYLLNAEHISTSDNKTLLLEIKHNVLDVVPQTHIVFLVNKVDSFDLESGDDLTQTLDDACQDLEKLGFKEPQVIPVMAYAARLFKMALTGQENRFTRKEKLEFADFFERCLEENLDLTKYQCHIDLPGQAPTTSGSVIIGKHTYDKGKIAEALRCTGICSVADLLDEAVHHYQPEDKPLSPAEVLQQQKDGALSEEEKELLADLNQWEQENVDEPLSEEQEMADLLADLDQWEENNS